MIIRKAELTDLDAIVPLFDAYRIFYGQTSDPEGAGKFLKERFLNHESIIFLAIDEDKAVGFTQLYPVFTSVGMKRAWLLNDLFVDASARKKGIATLLLERAKKHGRDTDSKWLLLSTGASNISAQSVYESNGWQRVSDYYYEFPL